MALIRLIFPLFAAWKAMGTPARALLTPSNRFGFIDERIDIWIKWRSIAAMGVATYATAYWKGFEAAQNLPNLWLGSAAVSVFVTGGCVILGSIIILFAAGRENRRASARCFRITYLVIAGVIIALAVVAVLLPWMTSLAQGSYSGVWLTLLCKVALPLVGIMGLTSNLWYGGTLLLQHVYRAPDAHPALRGLTTILVSIYTVITATTALVRTGLDPTLPTWAHLAFLYLTPLCTMALACWELHRLKSIYGYSIGTPVNLRPNEDSRHYV